MASLQYEDPDVYQEVQVAGASKGADAPVGGSFNNFVVKTGSNSVHGLMFFDREPLKLQSSNLTDDLIKQGAKLVDSAQDILEELNWAAKPAVAANAQAPVKADPLLDALGFDPVSLELLVVRTGWSAAELSTRLLDLELAGAVARLPGQLFQRMSVG